MKINVRAFMIFLYGGVMIVLFPILWGVQSVGNLIMKAKRKVHL